MTDPAAINELAALRVEVASLRTALERQRWQHNRLRQAAMSVANTAEAGGFGGSFTRDGCQAYTLSGRQCTCDLCDLRKALDETNT